MGIRERRGVLMLGDTLAILLAVLLALTIWVIVDGRGRGAAFVLSHAYWFPILAALWLLLAHANDLYNLRVTARLDTGLMRLIQVTLQMLVVYLGIFFVSPRDALPRLFILYYAVISFTLIALWRIWRPGWATAQRRALITGSGATACALLTALRDEAARDYRVVGLLADAAGPACDEAPLLGSIDALLTIARRENAAEVILAQDGEPDAATFQAILDAYEHGLSVVPMPVLYEQITGRVPVTHIGQRYWLLPTEGDSLFNFYPPVKRAMDITLAALGLAIFAILLPGIALAVRLDSAGPVLFRQERVGRGGRTFWLWKLRTMIHDAEAADGPQWTQANDPRITRAGRWLRRTRLDEVPQLINVLRGEMSLIGPRPERPAFIQTLSAAIPLYRARHAVQPGITGWAQVRGPYADSIAAAQTRLEYDLYYIRHRSLALDLVILLRTAGKVLLLQGR